MTPLEPLAGNKVTESAGLLTWPTRVQRDSIRILSTVPGDPSAKGRPRFSRKRNGRVYTPKNTADAELTLRLVLKSQHRNLVVDSDSAFGVRLLFFTATNQRRDLDNMVKLVWDACNGVVWADDSQVHELIARVVRTDPKPRTELAIYVLGVTARQNFECAVCGKPAYRRPSQMRLPGRNTCSPECTRALRVLTVCRRGHSYRYSARGFKWCPTCSLASERRRRAARQELNAV